MGAGIAQLAIEAGYETVGREVSTSSAEARDRIAHFLQRKVDKERMSSGERATALDRLSLKTELAAFSGCDLVIEAIVEDLEAKHALFAGSRDLARRDSGDQYLGALRHRDPSAISRRSGSSACTSSTPRP